ncbi:MAG: hypothetical protein M9894_04965 [Planctomycetes bacterium]|nr:hypothetical protein [Planctomycetota bacterium]
MTERGEFTRKFDREILHDASAEAEEREVQRRRLAAEDSALEAEFLKVLNILEHRGGWLRERFPRLREPKSLDFRGRRFEFADAGGTVVGWIEFRTRLSDSQQAIVIESFMQLDDVFTRRYDYVSFPKESVSVDRARRFVESKLLEFAGPYQDRYGASATR